MSKFGINSHFDAVLEPNERSEDLLTQLDGIMEKIQSWNSIKAEELKLIKKISRLGFGELDLGKHKDIMIPKPKPLFKFEKLEPKRKKNKRKRLRMLRKKQWR